MIIIVSLGTVKDYLKLYDFNEDDKLIQLMIDTAISNIKDSTGVDLNQLTDTQKSAKCDKYGDLAICMLVTHWYDNREIFSTKTKVNPLPHSIDSLLYKLRLYDETVIDG